MDKIKFGIVGAGPVGSIMGVHLAKASHNVTLVDILKPHLDEIISNGLSITGFKSIKAFFPKKNIC